MQSRVEEVAQAMTREMGKPIREARGEAARAVQILDYFAGEGHRPMGELYEQSASGSPVFTTRRPVGVVGLITPWNFPAAIPVWKLAPALAYGNAVVLKLAVDAPRTGLHIAECFAEAGLPAGVLNVLTGSGATVGAALVRTLGDPFRMVDWQEQNLALFQALQLERGARGGDRPRRARSARARRPEPADRRGRREPGRSGGSGVCRRVLVGRAEVHCDASHLR